MKTIAYYLPQFHETQENNKWWGKGFTEWNNVKSAKPFFDWHYQPKVPLEKNYYDLSEKESIKWQAKIAREYGIYGWCIYHYWFNGHKLLHKPLEMLLNNDDIDINYCICWANEEWTNRWIHDGKRTKTLIAQKYGDKKEWKEHYDYLKPYFKDRRYIRDDKGRPIIVIYRPELVDSLNSMLEYWNDLALSDGLKGICYAYQHPSFALKTDKDDSIFDYQIEYLPGYLRALERKNMSYLYKVKDIVNSLSEKYFHKEIDFGNIKGVRLPTIYDYDKDWNIIINSKPLSEKTIPGAFVDWDNTPRWGERGTCYMGVEIEKFEKYFSRQIQRARNIYKKDMLFIFAWNEWGEGGRLEPDEKYGYGFLESIKKALIENDEFPNI